MKLVSVHHFIALTLPNVKMFKFMYSFLLTKIQAGKININMFFKTISTHHTVGIEACNFGLSASIPQTEGAISAIHT